MLFCFFFFQAEDGIRYLVRSRGLGDVYKRQVTANPEVISMAKRYKESTDSPFPAEIFTTEAEARTWLCLLYTSDAADERSSVDLGGRRIIKKKTKVELEYTHHRHDK